MNKGFQRFREKKFTALENSLRFAFIARPGFSPTASRSSPRVF